ncbi:Glutathione S-transferase S1 [Mortierella sp. GBA30]|nr:Glutathione S-transferase S1 [Mortierella sp. GBA30]
MTTLNLDFEENSILVASDKLKYELKYFPLHFGGTNARGDWPADKPNTLFGQIPVLTIIHPDGKKIELGESAAIDIFLAKQFGLHGNNAWEEAVINALYAHSNHFWFFGTMANFFWSSTDKTDEEKAQLAEKYLNESLTNWATIHETTLIKNNNTGHYVGNRTTLADIRSATLLGTIEVIFGKERVAKVVNETKTPAIVKLRATIESKPSYAAWIESDTFKNLTIASQGFAKQYHGHLF